MFDDVAKPRDSLPQSVPSFRVKVGIARHAECALRLGASHLADTLCVARFCNAQEFDDDTECVGIGGKQAGLSANEQKTAGAYVAVRPGREISHVKSLPNTQNTKASPPPL